MNDSRAPKVIDLVYFNEGGGHRAAATALETVIREQGRPWQVRRYWRRTKPDMVVSLIPNFNRAVFEIPRILESIMESGRPCTHRAPASDDTHGAAVLS